jgi:O-acetyl-ADP-ribose deacetylase (regulator of RNase III)
VGGGADGDDARRCTLPEKSAEKVREKKGSKVIDGKCRLKSINRE